MAEADAAAATRERDELHAKAAELEAALGRASAEAESAAQAQACTAAETAAAEVAAAAEVSLAAARAAAAESRAQQLEDELAAARLTEVVAADAPANETLADGAVPAEQPLQVSHLLAEAAEREAELAARFEQSEAARAEAEAARAVAEARCAQLGGGGIEGAATDAGAAQALALLQEEHDELLMCLAEQDELTQQAEAELQSMRQRVHALEGEPRVVVSTPLKVVAAP